LLRRLRFGFLFSGHFPGFPVIFFILVGFGFRPDFAIFSLKILIYFVFLHFSLDIMIIMIYIIINKGHKPTTKKEAKNGMGINRVDMRT